MLLTYLKGSALSPASALVDWLGIGLSTAGFGSLQFVLAEGGRLNWFDDARIVVLSMVSAAALISLSVWQCSRKNLNPVIDIAVLRNGRLLAAIALLVMIGVNVAGISYLFSLMAEEILMISPLQTGLLLAPGGLTTALGIIVCGDLLARFPRKANPVVLILFGLVLTLLPLWRFARLSPEVNTDALRDALAMRGFALGFLMMPLNNVILCSLAAGQEQSGLSLMNLADQLGGSFGMAMLGTYVTTRFAVHWANLSGYVSAGGGVSQARLGAIASFLGQHGMSSSAAHVAAPLLIARSIETQAWISSYNDAYFLLFAITPVTAPAALLLRPGRT